MRRRRVEGSSTTGSFVFFFFFKKEGDRREQEMEGEGTYQCEKGRLVAQQTSPRRWAVLRALLRPG